MNLKRLINRNYGRQNKSHVKNLIEVALSDGSLDGEEMELLLKLAKNLDISQINNKVVEFHPPRSAKERFKQVCELVCMMMVDGEINKNELKLCKELALRLGYLPLIVDDLIPMIKRNIAEGMSFEDSYQSIKKRIK